MSVTIEPLPEIIRCSTRGCPVSTSGKRGASDAVAAGWTMICGAWLCPEDAERGRQAVIDDMQRLDGMDQGEAADQEEIELPEVDLGGES